MTLTVRSAASGDEPALRELFLRSRRDTFAWQPADSFQLADFDAQTQGERLWVAQDGAQTAGFISLWEPENFIHHMYVDRRWHRRGVGRALLAALPSWPHTRFTLKCLRRNEAALAFYGACGFAEVGAGTSQGGAYLLMASGRESGDQNNSTPRA